MTWAALSPPRWAAALALLTMAACASPTSAANGVAPLAVATQFVFPVGDPAVAPTFADGNANGYTITQGFNTSCDPNAGEGHYYAGYFFCGHTGVDLSASGSYGGPVRAIAAGRVVFAGPDGSYGNMVRIAHLLADGAVVYSQYEHLGDYTVKVWTGETVAAGDQIGAVGASGFAQGAHLHFEIKDSDSDGPGYTFGNIKLLSGFYDPLAFVIARLPLPTPAPVIATAVTAPLPHRLGAGGQQRPAGAPRKNGTDQEGTALVRRFLSHYRYFVTVNTPALRLRRGPGTDQRQVGVVQEHTKLALLGASGAWLHVALPENVTGWVHGSWVIGAIPAALRAKSQAPRAKTRASAPTPMSRRPDIRRLGPLARVITDRANVHQDPALAARVLFSAHRTSMAAVRAMQDGWVRLTFTNGATGWVLGDYLALPAQAAHRVAPHVDIHTLGPLARVSNDGVRVRQGPRLRNDVLFLAYRNSMVAVRDVQVSWARVTFTNGATGWILRAYLEMPHARQQVAGLVRAHPATRKAPAPRAWRVYYTWATTLYVRAAPRLAGAVVALAGENTPVRLLGTHVSWSHVRLPSGTEGWVLSHYIKDRRKITPAGP